MKSVTIEAHATDWSEKAPTLACKVIAVVTGSTEECPEVVLHKDAWAPATNELVPLYALDESIEDLHDAAFLEACELEVEEAYEAIEASEIGF